MFKGFSFILLRVRDVDEAIDFYTRIFGFYLLRKYSFTSGGPAMAYVGLNGVLLELVPAGDGAVSATGFGLEVDDLDAALAYLKTCGVEMVREQFTPRTFWG